MRLALLVATGLVAVATESTTAVSPYVVTETQWTIFALSVRCVAVNRPPEEINASPYNALWLSKKVGQAGTELQVFYWPGAFKAGDRTTLAMTFDGGLLMTYPATAMDEFTLKTDAPLSDKDVAELGRSQLTTATSGGLVEFFLTDKLPAVAGKLSECVASLPAGG
jgi:hypothetical protein